MNLWLDDIRDPNAFGRIGWTWVKTAEHAIEALKSGLVNKVSLDHDLASEHYPWSGAPESQYREQTGYSVVCWMEENNCWPPGGTQVHSQNPAGRARMQAVIDRHYRETQVCRIDVPTNNALRSLADPAGVLSGATWRRCGEPGVAKGKLGELLCEGHARDYPGLVDHALRNN